MAEFQGWTEGPVSFDVEVWHAHLADLKERRDQIPDFEDAVARAERSIQILTGGGDIPNL